LAIHQTSHRRPGLTLYRYLAAEILRPFAFALLGLTLVILTTDLIGFSELVINRGLGAGEVSLIAFYEAVPVAGLIFPFAVLIGSLVALGRLGADREILVLEASGVSAPRLIPPVLAFAAVMTVLAAGLALVGAPAANRALDASLERIGHRQPWASFRAGAVSRFGGWQVEAREVSAKGDELRGVLLWMPDIAETIFARRGRVEASEDGAVEITLRHGSLALFGENGAQQIRFQSLRTTLPQSDEPVARPPGERIRGATLAELRAEVAAFVPSAAAPVSAAWVELHRRLAVPAATLIFGFLAVPLLLTRRNLSRSGGSVLGVATTILYFALVQLGEGLIQGGMRVAAGVWLPNAVLLLLAVWLFVRARREGVLGHRFDRPQPSDRLDRSARPSRGRPHRYALPRYVAGRFLELVGIAFAVLLTAYLLIDVMERLDWFARYHASGGEILRFYAVRVPLLASRVVPMSLLVGTALVVSLLAVEGELMGMRACGIPAPRALLPVLLLSLGVAPAYFVLRNVVVPRTNAMADALKQSEIKEDYYRELAERRKTAVWYRFGSRVLAASRFDTELGDARDLTIYEIGEDGLPASRTDAIEARHIGRGIWRLRDPRRIEIAPTRIRQVPALTYANLGEALPAEVDTMHLSVGQLAAEIEAIERDGYDATPLRVDFHVKLADALACIVLPASVLFFAVGGPPFPGPAKTLLVSGALAVGYILLTGVGASFGYGGTLPPALAGWGPTGVIAAIAAWLAARLGRGL
jgi:lipopolysaccharide export system permease protein